MLPLLTKKGTCLTAKQREHMIQEEKCSLYELQGYLLLVTLTSAACRFCRVTGVTIEEAADLSGLSKDRRSRQEPFPKGGQKGRERD